MKLLITTFAMVMAVACSRATAAEATEMSLSPAIAQSNDPDVIAIRDAPDISAAAAAYAKANSAHAENPLVYETYLRRLIDVQSLQDGYAPALKLCTIAPDNGLGWGALAFVNATKGDMPDAITDIASAADRAADDPFVRQTAGSILAWYDNQANPPVNDSIKGLLDRVKRRLVSTPEFRKAYGQADQAYKVLASQQARTPPEALAPPPGPVPPVDTGGYPQGPAYPAGPGDSDYYNYYYPSGFVPYDWPDYGLGFFCYAPCYPFGGFNGNSFGFDNCVTVRHDRGWGRGHDAIVRSGRTNGARGAAGRGAGVADPPAAAARSGSPAAAASPAFISPGMNAAAARPAGGFGQASPSRVTPFIASPSQVTASPGRSFAPAAGRTFSAGPSASAGRVYSNAASGGGWRSAGGAPAHAFTGGGAAHFAGGGGGHFGGGGGHFGGGGGHGGGGHGGGHR